MKKNSLLTFCSVVPALILAIAHWMPWQQLLGRKLHRLEAYLIGTTAIVGTTAIAIANSDGNKDEHIEMLLASTASGGAATLMAWGIDGMLGLESVGD